MSKYIVKLSGKDLTIEHSVNRALADKIALLLINERVGMTALPSDNYTNQVDSSVKAEIIKPIVDAQISEFSNFIDARGVSGSGELVTCLGIFLHKKGQIFFTKNEYRSYFKMLRGKAPTNLPRDLNKALTRNWISEGVQDQFKVTSAGEKMANEKLKASELS